MREKPCGSCGALVIGLSRGSHDGTHGNELLEVRAKCNVQYVAKKIYMSVHRIVSCSLRCSWLALQTAFMALMLEYADQRHDVTFAELRELVGVG